MNADPKRIEFQSLRAKNVEAFLRKLEKPDVSVAFMQRKQKRYAYLSAACIAEKAACGKRL